MNSFTSGYERLNAAQKQAVDTIEGPVMVVAGPGTGKTQLLSMRVANILKSTDVLPGNILCLTFTESGAMAMRERLISIIGQEAYGVAIHTFHSFGSEVISNYGQYFYNGAEFQAADELSTYEILKDLFTKLPHDSPLGARLNDEYTYLRDAQNTISHLKKSGLTSDELLVVLDHNHAFIEYAEPLLQQVFTARITKATIAAMSDIADEIKKYQPEPLTIPSVTQLYNVFCADMEEALLEAESSGKPAPLTVLKSKWLEKDSRGRIVFKDRKKDAKLRAVAGIYFAYLNAMRERSLYDFDDMILRVVHAVEIFAELRYDLQEKYQYILVDEFQDTNGAQLRLLLSLVNNGSNDDQPNIMIVGDDDQAIYAFQGAKISNILTFKERFDNVEIINLTENYRSDKRILSAAREVVVMGDERLENVLPNLNKSPVAHHAADNPEVELTSLPTLDQEYHHVVQSIKSTIASGVSPEEIVVLARNHSQLQRFIPYMHHARIDVAYERRDNVLHSPPVVLLEQLAVVTSAIGQQQYDIVDAKLPELLAHPAWGIAPKELMQLGITAYENKQFWLETMLEHEGHIKDIAEWIVVVGHESLYEPLEVIIDKLIGNIEPQTTDSESADDILELGADAPSEDFSSPLRDYFFEQSSLENNPARYLDFLGALTALRRRVREYLPNQPLSLSDFVTYLNIVRETKLTITNTSMYRESATSVHLMTAHKSKGLEFDHVFIINAVDSIWGHSARSRPSMIGLPNNLPIAPAGENDDERLRLLFVAMTRARNGLHISLFSADEKEKSTVPAKYLIVPSLHMQEKTLVQSTAKKITTANDTWHDQIVRLPSGELHELLKPRLERYSLSATHLNNFLDVTNGGPQAFLLQNLLRFPQAQHSAAVFGSAIHESLKLAHRHLSATGNRKPLEDILQTYEVELSKSRLSQNDYDLLLARGTAALNHYFGTHYDRFTQDQISEKDFVSQGVVINNARLSGKIDLLEVDEANNLIKVSDYKTGKALSSWTGKTDYDKIKLHKYKQQLMFYKLLVENARDYHGLFKVEIGSLLFVEPDEHGDSTIVETFFDHDEMERLTRIIEIVWQKIINLDIPDTTSYDQSYKGILSFEADLLDGNI